MFCWCICFSITTSVVASWHRSNVAPIRCIPSRINHQNRAGREPQRSFSLPFCLKQARPHKLFLTEVSLICSWKPLRRRTSPPPRKSPWCLTMLVVPKFLLLRKISPGLSDSWNSKTVQNEVKETFLSLSCTFNSFTPLALLLASPELSSHSDRALHQVCPSPQTSDGIIVDELLNSTDFLSDCNEKTW